MAAPSMGAGWVPSPPGIGCACPPVLPEPWEPPPHSAVPWVLSEVHHKHAEPQLSVRLGWGLCWETAGSSRVSMTCFCSLRPGMLPPTPALQ